MDLGRRGGEEELEGAEGVKTLIRIYYLKKKPSGNGPKKQVSVALSISNKTDFQPN